MAAMSQPPLAPAPFSSAAPPAPSLPSGTASGGSGRGAPPSVLWGAAPASSASGGGGGSAAPLSKYKVVFVGDQGSGKTSIIKAFIYGSFDYNYKITVGIDFLSKTMYVDERPVRLQIWDSAGQERFRSLIPSYIRDSSVAVVVYDVTSRSSFASVTKWIEDVRAERGTDVVIMLVGNKMDLRERRQISTEEGEKKARDEGVLFLEASAKAGYNIKALFRTLATAGPGAHAVAPEAAPESKSNVIDIRLKAPSEGGGKVGVGAGGATTSGACCS